MVYNNGLWMLIMVDDGEWLLQSVANLVQITTVSLGFYDTHNELVRGVYKPTDNGGGTS